MPLKTFRVLDKNIDRIQAGNDYRMLQTVVSGTTGEGAEAHARRLLEIVGSVMEFDQGEIARLEVEHDDFDRDGVEWLKRNFGRKSRNVPDSRRTSA
jgi:integrase